MSMDEFFPAEGHDLFDNLHVWNCADDVFERDLLKTRTPTSLPHALVDMVAVPTGLCSPPVTIRHRQSENSGADEEVAAEIRETTRLRKFAVLPDPSWP
jgi:hypothetical protein